MNIDEMPAGQELDVLIAEKVMGWIRHERETEWDHIISVHWTMPNSTTVLDFPRFSQDIAAAWGVVAEITKNKNGVSLRLVGPEYADGWMFVQGWHATFIEPTYTFTDVGEGATADTASLAICRAAYKFIEGQRGDGRQGDDRLAENVTLEADAFQAQVEACYG